MFLRRRAVAAALACAALALLLQPRGARAFSMGPGLSSPCNRRGFCVHGRCTPLKDAGHTVRRCVCNTGYRGIRCEHKAGCFPPCEHGGRCNMTSRTCRCQRPYFGQGCHSKRGGKQECSSGYLHTSFAKINQLCCRTPTGKRMDCGTKPPSGCSAACAKAFLGMWNRCSKHYPQLRRQFDGFAATCNKTQSNNANKHGVGEGFGIFQKDKGCTVDKHYPFHWKEISPHNLSTLNTVNGKCIDSKTTHFKRRSGGGLLSCRQLQSFCMHRVYGRLIGRDCPRTCNRCKRTCKDSVRTRFRTNRSPKRLKCSQLIHYCRHWRYSQLVVAQCPVTCDQCNMHQLRQDHEPVGKLISRHMWGVGSTNRKGKRIWKNSDDGWYDVRLPSSGLWRNGFPYYGKNMRTVSIGTNGLITFGTPQLEMGSTEPIPCAGKSKCPDGKSKGLGIDGLIAAMWADLYPGAGGGDVYYLITNTSMIIEYASVKSWSYTCPLGGRRGMCWNLPDPGQSFQVELWPSGAFVFRYLSMYCQKCLTSWSTTSIGFEDQSGTKGQQISYGAIPKDRTAYFVPSSCTSGGNAH